MITKILARSFKGLSFDREIGQYTLFVGPNGSGKTAISQAAILTIMDYLPSDQDKQPSAIFKTHATGEEMVVGIEISGSRFIKKYKVTEDGSVSREASSNGKKIPAKLIDRTLIELGNPRIFDLQAFNDLSEQKKIEFLLSLSPPSGDLRKIEQEMIDAEEKEKRIRADIRGKRMIVEQLTGERSALKLPAGTLAEIQAEIKTKTADLEKAGEDLKQAELEEQKRKDEEAAKERERIAKEGAEEKARKEKAALEGKALKEKAEAEAKAKREAETASIIARNREIELQQMEKLAKQREAEALKSAEAAQKDLEALGVEMGRREKEFDATLKELAAQGPRATCAGSLKKVRQVLVDAGCESCAGLIVLNMELQRYEENGDSVEA